MDLAQNYIPGKALKEHHRIVVLVGRMKEMQVLVRYRQVPTVLEHHMKERELQEDHSLELQAVEDRMKELQELVAVPLLQEVVCRSLLPEL
jgi:hypothetical protein